MIENFIQGNVAPYQVAIQAAYRKLEDHGFPPEFFGWPFINLGAERLPASIEAVLSTLSRQRDELLAEVLELRKHKKHPASQSAVDIDFLEVEPSDSERAAWPDQTRAYVESLEQLLRAATSKEAANG